jgi:hypothetical protein
MALTLATQSLFPSLLRTHHKTDFASIPQPGDAPTLARIGSVGPWGDLEYEKIPLENSEEFIVQDTERLKEPQWVFEGFTKQQLVELLLSCRLTHEQKASLLETNRWKPLTNGYAISPSEQDVIGLGNDARQRLYPVLARSAANASQYHPFRCPIDAFAERFANIGLPDEKLKAIRSLSYTNEGYLCLCVDKPFADLFTTNEFRLLVKSFYSISNLRVWLRVTPATDIETLLKYWGKGGRAKALQPFFESVARKPGGGIVNVSFFLPAFAASRLYTYPDPATDPEASKEDCFYTALNFFNALPDPRFIDMQFVRTTLLNDYSRVVGKPMFGDLIVLLDSSNNGVHACIHVADDIVYTKNGMDLLQPWVLMKMPDMLALYPSEPPLQVVRLRRKEADSGAPAPIAQQKRFSQN